MKTIVIFACIFGICVAQAPSREYLPSPEGSGSNYQSGSGQYGFASGGRSQFSVGRYGNGGATGFGTQSSGGSRSGASFSGVSSVALGGRTFGGVGGYSAGNNAYSGGNLGTQKFGRVGGYSTGGRAYSGGAQTFGRVSGYSADSNSHFRGNLDQAFRGFSVGNRAFSGGSNRYSAGNNGYAVGNNGYSAGSNGYQRDNQYRNNEANNEPARYEFRYDVNAPEYSVEFGHQEQRDGDNTNGAYYVLLPDGRRQLVEYTADLDGYHPRVSYTEATGPAGSGNYQRGGNYQTQNHQGSSRSGYQQPGSYYQSDAGFQSGRNGQPEYNTGSGY